MTSYPTERPFVGNVRAAVLALVVDYVEMRGDCREVYAVEADSEEEAMANWAQGDHVITETMGIEPVSARLEEE